MMYYFGCWDRSGHSLRDSSGNYVHGRIGPFTAGNLDGTFPNHMYSDSRQGALEEDETIASLAHWKGWTVLAMWDRSVDTRGACNAAFVAEGEHTHAEMWAMAREHFPKIVARLKAAPKP